MRLSVILSNYNHGHYLKDRIPSILSQLGEDDEFIITDDASTDDSVAIVEQFTDPRLRFFKNEKNLGVIANCYKGLERAQGKYLFCAAADDIILPGFIEQSMKALQSHPEAALSCTDHGSFTDSKENFKSHFLYKEATSTLFLQPEQTLSLFRNTNFLIYGLNVILRRSLFSEYGGLDPALGPYCDWFLWHTVALNKPIVYTPKILVLCRVSNENYSIRSNTSATKRSVLFKLSKNPSIKKQFLSAILLYPFIRKNIGWALSQPALWGIFAQAIPSSLLKRWRMSFAKRLTKMRT